MPGGSARVERLTGDALSRALGDVARLRIAVFREWPYLYDGTLSYEQDYLAEFARAQDAIVVAALDGNRIVGAATAAPLEGHTAEFAPLLAGHGLNPDLVFYLGESVLLPHWRGQGLGHAFFDHREAHARSVRGKSGAFTHAAFCAVVRAPDDPRAPSAYRSLDAFWHKRGYAPAAGLIGSYRWKEIGEAEEREHPMQFWVKSL